MSADIQNVSYEPGEFVLVRTTDVVALVDDSASSPEAINTLIGAVTLGDRAALLALITGAPQFMSLAVLIRADAGWQLYLYGQLACATESTSALTLTSAKPDQLHTYALGDKTSVTLQGVRAQPVAPSASTELAAGVARAMNATVDFDAKANVVALVVESPTRTAAVLAPDADISPTIMPTSSPPQPATAPAAAPAPAPAPATAPAPADVPKTTRMVLPPQAPVVAAPSAPAAVSESRTPPAVVPGSVDLVDLNVAEVTPRAALDVASPVSQPADLLPDPKLVEVLGVRCPADHHNHPNAVYCAQCGRRMGVNQTAIAQPGPRPPLGLFLLSDGSSFPIASDMIVGRDPSGHGDVVEGRAEILRLSDDRSEISRSHVGVYLDNWSVTVIDLGSANGTLLRRDDGSEWAKLATDAKVLLTAGDTLRVGAHELRLELHHVQA